MRRVLLLGGLLLACRPTTVADVDPSLAAAGERGSPMGLHDALEARIQAGTATAREREYAYASIQSWEDDGTAEYAFVRAALAGRLAQERGLAAIGLVKETERWATTSIERDPEYRKGAARRMLGTLYVLAGNHVEHGDSEEGLSMLEDLADQYPDDPVNQLRVGEGYVSLGDPEGGFEALCRAHANKSGLSPEEADLLTRLIKDAGGMDALGCGAG